MLLVDENQLNWTNREVESAAVTQAVGEGSGGAGAEGGDEVRRYYEGLGVA